MKRRTFLKAITLAGASVAVGLKKPLDLVNKESDCVRLFKEGLAKELSDGRMVLSCHSYSCDGSDNEAMEVVYGDGKNTKRNKYISFFYNRESFLEDAGYRYAIIEECVEGLTGIFR